MFTNERLFTITRVHCTYVTAYLVIIQRCYVGLQLRANALGSKQWGPAPFCRPDIQIEAIGVRYLPKISGQV